jgi:hypothetical protein
LLITGSQEPHQNFNPAQSEQQKHDVAPKTLYRSKIFFGTITSGTTVKFEIIMASLFGQSFALQQCYGPFMVGSKTTDRFLKKSQGMQQ